MNEITKAHKMTQIKLKTENIYKKNKININK